jgi:hypothetical protein
MDLDDLQNIKIIVDFGNGTKWTYENINAIIADDKLISLEDVNSTIHVLNIEALSVTVTKNECDEDKNKTCIEKIKNLIQELNQTCIADVSKEVTCTKHCSNCENGCNGNCCC